MKLKFNLNYCLLAILIVVLLYCSLGNKNIYEGIDSDCALYASRDPNYCNSAGGKKAGDIINGNPLKVDGPCVDYCTSLTEPFTSTPPPTGYAGDGTGSSASNPRYVKGCCSRRNTSIWQKAFNSKCDLACNFNTAHGGTSTGSGNASSSQCKDGDSIYSNCKGKDPSCVTGREDACKTLATTYFLGESNSNNMASPPAAQVGT